MKTKIKQARETLEKAGFYLGHLWHIDDVKGNYDCTDKQAMVVLDDALDNSSTMEQIFGEIDFSAENLNLKNLNE